jgi:hypothetical protein
MCIRRRTAERESRESRSTFFEEILWDIEGKTSTKLVSGIPLK